MPGRSKPGVDWPAFRSAWEAGQSLESLARKHGVTRQAVAKRRRKELWSRTEDAPALGATATMARLEHPVTTADKRIVNDGRRSPMAMTRLLDLAAAGATKELMAARLGMSRDALADWLNDDPTLAAEVDAARAGRALRRIEHIDAAAAKGDWRAASWALERDPLTRDAFAPKPPEGGHGAGPILIQINAPGFTGGAYAEHLKGRIAVAGHAPPLMPSEGVKDE